MQNQNVILQNYNGLYFLMKGADYNLGKHVQDKFSFTLPYGTLIGIFKKKPYLRGNYDGKISLITKTPQGYLIPNGFYNRMREVLENASAYMSSYEDHTNLINEFPSDWVKQELNDTK